MQMVSEVMTRGVMFVSPQESLQQAAQMMDDMNVGMLPVCDGERLVGMITDRDITVRSASKGKAPGESRVEEAMSADVRWCFEDQSLEEVMQQMADSQIRRVPVVSHDEAHRLVGIVALGDLATRTDETKKQEVEQVVEKVSSPSEPDRSQQAGAVNASAAGGGTKPGAGAGAAADIDAGKIVGAPGAAIAPGAPAGDKDAIGPFLDDEITGKGRQGRVGFAGDPGGLSPADIEESQRAAAGGAASGAESASTGGTAGAAGAAGGTDAAAGARGVGTAGSPDAKRDTGPAGGGGTNAPDAGGATGGTAGTGGSAKP
jgi:CBS domain-containing protein